MAGAYGPLRDAVESSSHEGGLRGRALLCLTTLAAAAQDVPYLTTTLMPTLVWPFFFQCTMGLHVTPPSFLCVSLCVSGAGLVWGGEG